MALDRKIYVRIGSLGSDRQADSCCVLLSAAVTDLDARVSTLEATVSNILPTVEAAADAATAAAATATAAEGAAVAAAADATAAAASAAGEAARFLLPAASDPTTRDNGDPLQDGDLYLNTAENEVRIYSGGSWTNPSAPQGALLFQDEGADLGTAGTVTTVDFVGAGVTATRAGNVVTVTIPGGGGGGGGTIPADTVIAYPGAYANWAALVADLKANVYTGTVRVDVAAGTYAHDFRLPDGFNMPNLRIAFDAGVQVDATGLPPNTLGFAWSAFGGTDVRVGAVSGAVTDVTPAPGGRLAMVWLRSEWTAGYTPNVEAAEQPLTFDGFPGGFFIVDTTTHGSAPLVVNGTASGQPLAFAGGFVESLKLSFDGEAVSIGATGGPFGDSNVAVFNFASIECTNATFAEIQVGRCTAQLGDLVPGAGRLAVTIGQGADVIARLVDGATYFGSYNIGSGVGMFRVGQGSCKVYATGAITYSPETTANPLASGNGRFELDGGSLTIDNAAIGGDPLDYLFNVTNGHCYTPVISGTYANVNSTGTVNTVSEAGGGLFSFNNSDAVVAVSTMADGGSEVFDAYRRRYWLHTAAGGSIASGTLTLSGNVFDEVTLVSTTGIAALTLTPTGGSPVADENPIRLHPNRPVTVRYLPTGNWQVMAGDYQPAEWVAVGGALANSWANIGAPWAPAAYRRNGDRVELRGAVEDGTSGVIFGLPTDLWPPYDLSFSVPVHDNTAAPDYGHLIVRAATGNVELEHPGTLSNHQVWLDGVAFSLSP